MEVTVRDARRDDPTAPLLYRASPRSFDAYAGDPERARRLVDRLYRRRANAASWQVCRVAVAGDGVVGVLAAYPSAKADRLAGVRPDLTVTPPWRWPRLFRYSRAAARVDPQPPARAWYVDALAVDPAWRRRGVATALLTDAEAQAHAHGWPVIALDAEIDNLGAQSLYAGAGFRRGVERHLSERDARMLGYAGVVPFVKTL